MDKVSWPRHDILYHFGAQHPWGWEVSRFELGLSRFKNRDFTVQQEFDWLLLWRNASAITVMKCI